jgi:hypothetical protein
MDDMWIRFKENRDSKEENLRKDSITLIVISGGGEYFICSGRWGIERNDRRGLEVWWRGEMEIGVLDEESRWSCVITNRHKGGIRRERAWRWVRRGREGK